MDVAEAVAAWLDPIPADGVDILVNNAGPAGPTAPVEKIDPSEWRRCVEASLSGQFYCARRVVPAMKERGGGVIVNITSTFGQIGDAQSFSLCCGQVRGSRVDQDLGHGVGS